MTETGHGSNGSHGFLCALCGSLRLGDGNSPRKDAKNRKERKKNKDIQVTSRKERKKNKDIQGTSKLIFGNPCDP